MPVFLLMILCLLPGAAFAGVYKCTVDGKTVYRDTACHRDAEQARLPAITTVQPTEGDDLAKRYDERLKRDGKARDKADAEFLKDHAAKKERRETVRAAIIDHRAIEGMTPGEVESALGPADEKLPDGVWRYRREQQRTTVAFKDGLVSSVRTTTEKKKK